MRGWRGAASAAVSGLSGMGFCCFPAGFSLDGPAPAGHRSRSPVLDPSSEKQDFPGMAWDGGLAPPSSPGRVLGGTCSCHPQPEFEGGLSPPERGEPAPMAGTPWSRCVGSTWPWVMQWGEMWGEMWGAGMGQDTGHRRGVSSGGRVWGASVGLWCGAWGTDAGMGWRHKAQAWGAGAGCRLRCRCRRRCRHRHGAQVWGEVWGEAWGMG